MFCKQEVRAVAVICLLLFHLKFRDDSIWADRGFFGTK